MIRKHVEIQTKSVKLIGTIFFQLYIMHLQHCVMSSGKSINSQQECCSGKQILNPIKTFVLNRYIINVFITEEHQKLCLKQKDPLFQLITDSINITCIGVNETLQCHHENISDSGSLNYGVMNISFINLLFMKCEVLLQIEPKNNISLDYIRYKQLNEVKECCVCQMFSNILTISSNTSCEVNISAVLSEDSINVNKSISLINESALQIEMSPNLKLFQINPLPYEAKENTTLTPYPLFNIIIERKDNITILSLQKFKWKVSIELLYEDIYPGKLLGTKNIIISDINLNKIMFNNLIVTKWGYDYMLKVMLKSIPDYFSIEKTLGPFNVWPINETKFNRFGNNFMDSRPISITLVCSDSDEFIHDNKVDLNKIDLYLINYFGRIYSQLRWKNFFTQIGSNKLVANAIISGSIENLVETNTKLLNAINSTLNFDNQSFIIADIYVNFESFIMKSHQIQPEYQQNKVSDNEPNSLPIAWIAAIIINAILVFLFIIFVIYCYCRSKKRRQRILNPEKDSIFSNKQSTQEVTSTEFLMKKDSLKNTNGSMKERVPTNQDIFTIESEHKKLTGEGYGEENDSPGLSPRIDGSKRPSLKSPINKIRSISRLSSGARGSVHNINGTNGYRYNPAESPSASMFSNQLKDSVPNQPKYNAKHEEEVQNGTVENDCRTMEPLAEVDENNRVLQEENDSDHCLGLNGDSGFTEHNYQLDSVKQNELQIDLENTDSKENRVNSGRRKPSISTASNIIHRVKSRGNSPNKVMSPKKAIKPPVSPPSSQSTGVQTSPNTSWLNIPGAVDEDNYYDETNYSLKDDTEKKYFIYIIKDVNPHAKKECVGRITLPTRQRITLEQLRNHLLQSSDETIRNAARRKFRFLSESYRLVALNEAFTPVDEVYPTQGIFIKFNALDSLPYSYRKKAKSKPINETEAYDERESIYVTRNRDLNQRRESIYGARNRGSTYGKDLNLRRESIYGPLRSNEKPRLGYDKTPVKRDPRSLIDRTPKKRDNFGIDRTPMKREQLDIMTPQPSIVSPTVSPRTRTRLCQKMQLQSQAEKSQLQETPNFLALSLDSICDNNGCTNKPLLKCLKCAKVNYCSPACKKQHWIDHRLKCKKPPWRA